MAYSVKKAGIPFYIKVDTGPDNTGIAANLTAYYIEDATGVKTAITDPFVEDANTPGLYRVPVTIPAVGDYTVVVQDTANAGVHVAAPVVVAQATIDDVKGVVDNLAVTLSNVETQVNSLDTTSLANQISQVEQTVIDVRNLINDTSDVALTLNGDETAILVPGANITGSTSGATGIVLSSSYDAATDTTSAVVTWTSIDTGVAFQVGETVTDGTNTTLGTIQSVITNTVNSVLEFVRELNAALADGASGLAALASYTDDVENLLLGVATLRDGTANPTAGKGLAQIYDRLDTGLTQLTSDLQAVQAAIQTDIANARASIEAAVAAVQTVVDANSALLNDTTNGLAAIKTAINNITSALSTHDADIKAILQAADGGLADIKATMIARFDAVDAAIAAVDSKVSAIQGSTNYNVFV